MPNMGMIVPMQRQLPPLHPQMAGTAGSMPRLGRLEDTTGTLRHPQTSTQWAIEPNWCCMTSGSEAGRPTPTILTS